MLIRADAAGALRGAFGAELHCPGDPGYDAARRVWRTYLDSRPALIAAASGPADVSLAVRAARDYGLSFAVRGTGHGALEPDDGALLLSTARMAAVEIWPRERVARVGAGARLGDVLTAAAPFGLVPLSGSSSWVGVTGYTVCGGTGILARKYGFAADSLLGADIVTAQGEHLTAGPDQYPDLFWALRGGGGNFGVVTRVDIRLYPVTRVYAGTMAFGIERARRILGFYREWADTLPDELSTSVNLARLPESEDVPEQLRGRGLVVVKACFLGPDERAGPLLAPLLAVGGPPLLGGFRPVSYLKRALTPRPRGAARGAGELYLFRRLPEAVIDALTVAVTAPGSPVSAIEVRHWGGAIATAGDRGGPAGHRDTRFSVAVEAPLGPGADPDRSRSALSALAERIRPHATGGSFLNLLNDLGRTRTAFTADNYQRLTELKRAYDPDNFFRSQHNVPPAPPPGRVAQWLCVK